MDKQKLVILAVAGAGKTYHICHSIDPKKRNLILAYTHENIHNIIRELMDANKGQIPEMTKVMTFHSFVYRNFICPYEPTIIDYFRTYGFRNAGITIVEPPSQTIKKHKKHVPNPLYKKKTQIEHYINESNQYYCKTLSELVLLVKNEKNILVNRAAQRLNSFFDLVLIDEFQDFRKHDYELILTLSKLINGIILVGDYYQHSVSANNNSGKPFQNNSGHVNYLDFKKTLEKAKFDIDDKILRKSRRCPQNITSFVRDKLEINIESDNNNHGNVIWVAEDQLNTILQNPSILKLTYNNSSDYVFKAMNWSYSKGDTVEESCVILTEDFEDLDKKNFSIKQISVLTRNKLYVALTRTKGNLYLVKKSLFDKYKDSYLKSCL